MDATTLEPAVDPALEPVLATQPEPFATERTAASAHLPFGPPERAWRRFDRLVVAGFVLGLLLPGLVMATGRKPNAIENRPIYTAPQFTLAGLLDGTWTAKLDAFLTDNIYFRPYAIRLRGELIWATGGTGTTNVVRGTDGWLYLGTALDPPCRRTAEDMLGQIGRLAAAFEANGQDFRFLPTPDKQSIYPEHVHVGLRPTTCAERDRAAFRAGLAALSPHAVDSWSVLEAAREAAGAWTAQTSLYFRKDSHWTPVGSAAAIRALIQSLDPTLWDEADVDRSGTEAYNMDLARLMGIRRSERVTRVHIRPGVTVSRADVPGLTTADGLEHSVFRETATGDRPTLPGRTLIIYDSFFGRDEALVAPFFADATWLHASDLINHRELVPTLGRFDRVIFERVERYLYLEYYATLLLPLAR